MNSKNPVMQWLTDLIRRDIWRKLVALFLALLLYLVIAPRSGEKHEKTIYGVPVKIELPEDLAFSGNGDRHVAIVLKAQDQETLSKVDTEAIRIRAEVIRDRYVPEERYLLQLRNDDVSGLVRGVKVASISPRALSLDLEPLVSKRVPVRARYDSLSKMPQDYKISRVRFIPETVLVSGPERVMKSVQEIYTVPIPLNEQVTESFEYRSSLNAPIGTRCDRQEIDVQIEVVEALTTHTFGSIPLLIIQSAERTRKSQVTALEPSTVMVVISGPLGTLSRMHSREINASISLDNIDKPGTYKLPVSININNPARGLTVKSFQPVSAQVTVKQE